MADNWLLMLCSLLLGNGTPVNAIISAPFRTLPRNTSELINSKPSLKFLSPLPLDMESTKLFTIFEDVPFASKTTLFVFSFDTPDNTNATLTFSGDMTNVARTSFIKVFNRLISIEDKLSDTSRRKTNSNGLVNKPIIG